MILEPAEFVELRMQRRATRMASLKFSRPHPAAPLNGLQNGVWCFRESAGLDLKLSQEPAWRSNGGPTRGHPARSFPFTLESKFEPAEIVRIHLIGVFAQFAGAHNEVSGTLGASLQLLSGEQLLFHYELVNGIHYSDASDLNLPVRATGDGLALTSIGSLETEEGVFRVDHLTLDVPLNRDVDVFKFKTLASPASFAIFDAYIETAMPHACPFHSAGGGVPLARIGSIVRLGDRVEFANALNQLEQGLLASGDLDEARGLALTFLAVLTAALLETGGSKQLVLEQLRAARELEHADRQDDICEIVMSRIETLVPNLFGGSKAYSDRLVDKALALIDRNFARPLSDASIANQLGLSTSHFRFLFKQATGQPFHKYVISARLEKAHRMLLEIDSASVSSVAKSVGFVGLSHFSRAFTQRFNVSPAHVRKNSAGHA